MLKGNKGEWGEIYAFSYLLATGKLYAADKDLNAIQQIYFPVLKIIREENANQIYSYHTGEKIKIFLGDSLLKEVGKEEFEKTVSLLYHNIPLGKRAFEINEADKFFESVYCSKLKAASNRKQDITLQIYDTNTGISPVCGFSIKSYLGASPTLVNSGESTNFYFELKHCNETIMNQSNCIETRTKIIDRMKFLHESGCVFLPESNMKSKQFEENVCFVDTIMPQFLSTAVFYSYKYQLLSCRSVIKKMKEQNPFNFSNAKMYEYKFKKFLCACALGMTPEKLWEGSEDANGGYIVVKSDGTVVCYHLYNRMDFEQYLFDYTCFDRPSTSRYKYMDIYEENGKYKIKLNLQIRFR